MNDWLRTMPSLKIITPLTLVVFCLSAVLALAASKKEVVVYTALDQIFSEPVLKAFEQQYNIKVRAVYDVEAVKTTGLVNRLLAEKNTPRCDVFWNNEIMRTILLKRKQLLAPYISPAAHDIPNQFKDPEGYWTGFAARARVLVVNTNLVSQANYPASLQDLLSAQWKGKIAMANPLFGTTATHVAALYATNGAQAAAAFWEGVRTNQVNIVDGNSVVRDMVGAGSVHFGITDTDDANMGIISGMPIKMIFPDQADKGTLVIPNTVALIKGGPHLAAAKKLIDFLLSPQVEQQLARSGAAQIPLRKGIALPDGQFGLDDISALKVDFEKIADNAEQSTTTIQKLFMR